MCEIEDETLMHVLWECHSANDIWGSEKNCVQKWGKYETDFLLLWEKCITSLDKSQLEELAMTLRKVWLRRNRMVFENRMECPMSLLFAKAIVRDYQAVRNSNKSDKQVQNRIDNNQRWEKSEKRYVKVNWDASLDQKKRRMDIGIIVRDEEGKVVATVFNQKENVEEAVVAEGYALRAAIELCSTLNIQKANFEGDAKEIIMAVCNEEEMLTSYGFLVEDVRF
ncbi:hypothetical protein F2P56_030995 [Juglans regia]|uniref:Uncharacterized protein LOC108999714 n=2 Tax=Juglans regia TaxID=51240 RepID=A0A6P9E7M0_JUGRE|nr:uncharacterized protein LOC108999714 [Juglans regia]KAF5450665.1 hypothetical protein F2P56_030995 [Juglans regia]